MAPCSVALQSRCGQLLLLWVVAAVVVVVVGQGTFRSLALIFRAVDLKRAPVATTSLTITGSRWRMTMLMMMGKRRMAATNYSKVWIHVMLLGAGSGVGGGGGIGETETDTHTEREIERERGETDRQTMQQADRQTNRKRDTDRERCPISKKTTSAIPFSQPIEQDTPLRPFCCVL